jgi:hypothetical protein
MGQEDIGRTERKADRKNGIMKPIRETGLKAVFYDLR